MLDAYFISESAVDMLGYQLTRWMEHGFILEIIHPDDRPSAVEVFRAVGSDGRSRRFDHRATTSYGMLKRMRTEVHLLRREGGRNGLLGIMVELDDGRTELGELESPGGHWRESVERRLRTLLAHAPIALFALDSNGLFTFAAGRGFEAIGIDDDRAIGSSIDERYRQCPWIVNAAHRAVAGEVVVCGGEVGSRWFETLLVPSSDQAGHVVEVVGLATNVTALRQAEREVCRTAQRLNEAQAIAHIGHWEWDVVEDCVSGSDELFCICGLPRTTTPLAFEQISRLVHAHDRRAVQETLRTALASKQPFSFVHRMVRPDGESRILEWRGRVFADADGRAARLSGTCQDVTEQRVTEQELERSVTLLRATLEATQDGILVVSPDGHALLVNEMFNRLWSLGSEKSDSDELIDAMKQKMARPELLFDEERTLSRRPQQDAMVTVELKSGTVLQAFSQLQRGPSADRSRVWSFRDVTAETTAQRERDRLLAQERLARMAAEEANRGALLLAEASRLLTSLDHQTALSTVAQLVVDGFADCCIVDLLTSGQGIRRVALACSDPDMRTHANEVLEELVSDLRPEIGAHEVVRTGRATMVANLVPSGRRAHEASFPIGSYLAVPLASRGKTLGVITMLSARSNRRFGASDLALAESLASRAALAIDNAKLLRDTQDALRQRDDFLAVASHELRTPVTSLRLTVEGWLTGGLAADCDPGTHKFLGVIDRQTRQIANLVNTLLDVAKLHSEQMQLNLTPVDLGEVVQAVSERLRDDADRAGSKIEVITTPRVIGQWDRALIDRMITNLLVNAIKYGNHRAIRVVVTAEPGTARLAVQDEGIGIPADRIDSIFERFSRAVSRHHYGGLGLGLYLVRRIVAAFGGAVRVHSTAGRGSTFEVELPCSGAPLAAGVDGERRCEA